MLDLQRDKIRQPKKQDFRQEKKNFTEIMSIMLFIEIRFSKKFALNNDKRGANGRQETILDIVALRSSVPNRGRISYAIARGTGCINAFLTSIKCFRRAKVVKMVSCAR